MQDCEAKIFPAGTKFPLTALGNLVPPEPLEKGIRPDVWEMVLNAPPLEDDKPSADVLALTEQRQQARAEKKWAESDRLRDLILAHGWTVQDTKDGQKLIKS